MKTRDLCSPSGKRSRHVTCTEPMGAAAAVSCPKLSKPGTNFIRFAGVDIAPSQGLLALLSATRKLCRREGRGKGRRSRHEGMVGEREREGRGGGLTGPRRVARRGAPLLCPGARTWSPAASWVSWTARQRAGHMLSSALRRAHNSPMALWDRPCLWAWSLSHTLRP